MKSLRSIHKKKALLCVGLGFLASILYWYHLGMVEFFFAGGYQTDPGLSQLLSKLEIIGLLSPLLHAIFLYVMHSVVAKYLRSTVLSLLLIFVIWMFLFWSVLSYGILPELSKYMG